MTLVKIQIPDRKQSAMGMLEMSLHGRVDCYADNTYIVHESSLKVLDKLGIRHIELERGGPGFAEKTLRDTLAAHVQRRKPRRTRKV